MNDEAETDETPAARPRAARRRSTAERIRAKQFPAAMRGYDRLAVDAWRDEMAELVTRLEQSETRDTAVRNAIDDLGRETSAIIQRAHESAGEIDARSRAQADARLEEADREAEATIRDAEVRAERLEEDARTIWEQRLRLIDEMRQLADEVLGVADDALERLDPPTTRRDGPMDAPQEEEMDEGDLGVLDTVEDEPTLEAESDTGDIGPGDEREAFDPEQTTLMRAPGDAVPGDTESFDVEAASLRDEPQTPDAQGSDRF